METTSFGTVLGEQKVRRTAVGAVSPFELLHMVVHSGKPHWNVGSRSKATFLLGLLKKGGWMMFLPLCNWCFHGLMRLWLLSTCAGRASRATRGPDRRALAFAGPKWGRPKRWSKERDWVFSSRSSSREVELMRSFLLSILKGEPS